MKRLVIFFSLSFFLFGANNIEEIDKNITSNKSKLQQKEKEKDQISNLLNSLGKTINEKHSELRMLNAQIQNIQSNINQNLSQNKEQEKTLKTYQNSLNNLEAKKLKIQNDITNILIKDMSFVMVLNHQSPISPDDIILQEIFKVLNQNSKNAIEKLAKQEDDINNQISQLNNSINKISIFINTQTDKKEKLQSMFSKQKKLMANLQSELNTYNERLKDIDKERKNLDSVLSNLNILKKTKEKELAEKKAKEEELKKQEALKKNLLQNNIANQNLQAPIEVKQVANSYQDISTTKYKGQKTIAPLESYSVEQKFGPYFDPVYKLKVFNESVTLVSKTPDALVRNIMDGKVVYAKEVPMLKKVVIIEHPNQLHTIYSQLDKIAPTIKPGLKIKKGYVIGRVHRKLGFEVTQKDKHIDPLEIISKSK